MFHLLAVACRIMDMTSWVRFLDSVLGTAAQQGTFEPDQDAKNTEDETDAGQDSAHDLWSSLRDPHTTCWSEDTGEEVPGETVSSSRGSRVEPVCRHHVVDGGCVDGVVGDTDEENTNACPNPCIVTVGRVGCGGKECQAECEAPRGVAEDREAALVLGVLALWVSGAILCVSSVEETDYSKADGIYPT